MSRVAESEQRWNDDALAQPLAAPAWRLWSYDAPAVVLGRSQRDLLAAVAATSPLAVLARGAGGGAVLVGPWMLGMSVALPPSHALAAGGPVQTYRWLGEALAEVLRAHGVTRADVAAPASARESPAAPDLAWACFAGLSPWEVVVGRRKIVGLAQMRRRHGVLLVAGVLLEPVPWLLLCGALGRPAEQAAALAAATSDVASEAGASAPGLAIAVGRMLAGRLAG